jgi:hypothetical protein
MTKEEIEIEILSDGRIQYTIKGVRGSACESISQLLEQLGRIESEEKTGEYYDLNDNAVISIAGQ